MITNTEQLDVNKTYSYADYLSWKLNEYVELIKGRIYKMAAPSSTHQKVLGRLHLAIGNYLYNSSCQVFFAPFDVRLTKYNPHTDKDIITVVQPDICIICDPTKIDKRGCLGAPDMIIELLSPATAAKDLSVKFDLYEENGVKEYWVVSSDKTVTIFDLKEDGKYHLRKIYTENDKVQVNILPDLYIDLSKIFKDIEEY